MESKKFKAKNIYGLSDSVAARPNSFFLFGLARLRFGIRVVAGIGQWHFCMHFFLPRGEFRAEFGCFFRIRLREILVFTGVGGEVVQLEVFIMIKLDELPVGITDGGAGFPCGAVLVRVMPVKCALAVVVAFELGHEALAVCVELGLRGEIGEFKHGGEKIHAYHRLA